MTVSSSANKVSYAGNGSTTLFSVGFYFFNDSDLLVVLRDADGIETVQTLTTDYTVSGAGNLAGGSITMTAAPATGETLVIAREVPLTQQTDYLANDPFPAESHERALDKLTMATQQLQEQVDRSAKLPISDPASADSLVADLVRVADSIDNVDTVATDIANVNTTATNIADVNTVAGISGNVTTVADISANVTAVAGNNANVTTVATNIANVNTVAGISTDVTLVAGVSTSVPTVAAIDTNVSTVAGVSTDVAALGPIAGNITTVAGISTDVTAVAADAIDIGTVSTNIANVNTVAGISANVTTVAGISTDVTAVAADATDIGTVATNIAAVNTVSFNIANVNTVAGLDTEITALGARTVEIDALYAEIDDIATKVSKTSDTGAAILPAGTEAQRDGTPLGGYLRFNTDLNEFEGYNGTAWASVGGSAISNDTTTATDLFPTFVDATTGTAANVYTSNDQLLYKPSTGELKSKGLVATNGIVLNAQVISEDSVIPAGFNAGSVGPVEIAAGVDVDIADGSQWYIA
jgi:hypothetical protein